MKKEKKMLHLQKFVLLLLISFAAATQAEPLDYQDCLPYTIVFGNGVGNTWDDALRSRDILKDLVGTKFKYKDINYDVAYNPTGGSGVGTLLDIVEVIAQKTGENNSLWSLSWKVIFGVNSKKEPNQSWVETIVQMWNEYNAKIVQGMRYNLAQNSTYYDTTVSNHVVLYKTLLTNHDDPQRVLLVAHSQGNLYGNIALRKLEEVLLSMEGGEKYVSRFGMVGVGSAADFVYKDGPYLTSTADNVINALRVVYPTVLLGNIDLPAATEYLTKNADGESVSIFDRTGHGFGTVYANSAYAGHALLKSHIEKQLNLLKDEDEEMGDTYKWSSVDEQSYGGLVADEDLPKYYGGNVREVGDCYEPNCVDWYNKQVNAFLNYRRTNITRPLCIPQCDYNLLGTSQKISAQEIFEQFLFPVVFDPTDGTYVGFPRNEVKIKYQYLDKPLILGKPPHLVYRLRSPIDQSVTNFLVLIKQINITYKACKRSSTS
jgi:hypothetical protein